MPEIVLNKPRLHPVSMLLQNLRLADSRPEVSPLMVITLAACHRIALDRPVMTPSKEVVREAICLEGFRRKRPALCRIYLVERLYVDPLLQLFTLKGGTSFLVDPKPLRVPPLMHLPYNDGDGVSFTAVLPGSMPKPAYLVRHHLGQG